MALKQGIATVVLGALVGFGVAPAVTPAAGAALEALHFQPDPDKLPLFAAFVVGLAAVGVVGAILDYLKFRRRNLTDASAVDPSKGA